MKRFLLLALIFTVFTSNVEAQVQNYNTGDVVSDFTVTDIHGNEHNLYTYIAEGKFVFLDFFFYNCGPCQTTSPIFNEFHEKYGCNSGDIICLTINGIGEDNASVEQFEENFGGDFSHAPAVGQEGGSEAVSADYNPQAFPTYCLIGPENKILVTDIWDDGLSVELLESALPNDYTPVLMSCIVGVTENELNILGVKVYPNPSTNNDFINVEVSTKVSEDVVLSVFDMLGKEVIFGTTEKLNSGMNTFNINISSLSQGLYFVKMKRETGNELFSFEVIK